MKTITITGVSVVGSAVTLTGVISDATFSNPAVQTSIPDVPVNNRKWWRTVRVSDQAVFCQRNGVRPAVDPVAITIPSVSLIGRTLNPMLSYPPLISAQPSDAATAFAKAVLTSNGTIPTDGDQVVVANKTYTAKTTLTPTEGQVLINGSAANFLINLKRAVDHTGTPDTDYKCAAANTQARGGTITATTLEFVSLIVGTAPNAYPSTTTASPRLTYSAATFLGGLAAAQFVVVAASEDSSAQTYLWQYADVSVKATATITSDATAPSDGDTVTIGNKTYTFKTALTLSTSANQVLIAGSAANALQNLKRAIDHTGTPGTDYGSETLEHTQVDGSTLTATQLTVVAVTAGETANTYAVSTASDHLSWATPTLVNGGWSTASGTVSGCAYTNGTTFTLTCTPTTTGQNGVLHRCAITNLSGIRYTDSVTLGIT